MQARPPALAAGIASSAAAVVMSHDAAALAQPPQPPQPPQQPPQLEQQEPLAPQSPQDPLPTPPTGAADTGAAEAVVVPSFCDICGSRNDGTLTSTHANTGGEEAFCTCPLQQPAQQEQQEALALPPPQQPPQLEQQEPLAPQPPQVPLPTPPTGAAETVAAETAVATQDPRPPPPPPPPPARSSTGQTQSPGLTGNVGASSRSPVLLSGSETDEEDPLPSPTMEQLVKAALQVSFDRSGLPAVRRVSDLADGRSLAFAMEQSLVSAYGENAGMPTQVSLPSPSSSNPNPNPNTNPNPHISPNSS